MFRESDERAPRKHATYSNKPVPLLQQQNYSCTQGDSIAISSINKADYEMLYGRTPLATIHDPQPNPIPVTSEVVYDPSHPDADWSGLVKSVSEQRRHMRNHPCQIVNLNHTEKGIVAVPAEKYAYHKKKNPKFCEGDKISSEGLIGGICSEEPFKTTYRALASGNPTSPSMKVTLSTVKPVNKQQNYPKNNKLICTVSQPLTRYSSQHVLGRSLLSNISESILSSLKEESELVETTIPVT